MHDEQIDTIDSGINKIEMHIVIIIYEGPKMIC